MIGNDLVDFKKALIESNWHRKGYLEKLFSVDEQRLIANSLEPDRMVWLLWTMKESSYKIHFRQYHTRSFQPRNIICSDISMNRDYAHGHVHYNGQHYFSESILSKDFVHTTSVIQPDLFSKMRVIIGDDNKVHVDDFLADNQLSDYRIIKNKYHIPVLVNRAKNEQQLVSISHHGRFMSLVYLPNHRGLPKKHDRVERAY